ncbi:MAG: hydrolase, partial [Humibacillus sp.]|nr:hydrolase [Humibacillus sp.]
GRAVSDGPWAALHADAVARLTAWAAPDEDQERLRVSLLEHLRAEPLAVAKAGPPAHLTASVVVLDDALESVLLTHHRRALAWFQLGGHLETGDATLHAAATREAVEESGIPMLTVLPEIVQLDRHVLDGDFGTCREHLDVRYAAVVASGVTPAVSSESLDLRWWPCNALPEQTRAELEPLVAAGRRAVRLSRR